MHRTDVIHDGADLEDHLEREFAGTSLPAPAPGGRGAVGADHQDVVRLLSSLDDTEPGSDVNDR